jgi:hypothetical protein
MTPEQAAELRKPFPDSAIGTLPKGGTNLSYVGHAATTDRLLSVDPAWTWRPLATDDAGLPALDRAGNLWIELTVCGVTRLGVGDGKSAKECIGDAIRNAAMRFGVALDLWSKEELEQSHGPAAVPPADPPSEPAAPAVRTMSRRPSPERAPAPISPEQRTKIMAQFGDLKITDRSERLAKVVKIIDRDIESSNDLTSAEASKVIGQLDLELIGGP